MSAANDSIFHLKDMKGLEILKAPSKKMPTIVAPGDSIQNGIVKRESDADKTQKTVDPPKTDIDKRLEAIIEIRAEINAAINSLPKEYQLQVRAVVAPQPPAPTANIAIFQAGGFTASAPAPSRRHSKTPKSRYKGVGWHRRNGKWQAMIGWHGKRKHLGYFMTEEEAAIAYDSAARQVQANPILNFPTAEDIALRGALRAVPLAENTADRAQAKQIQEELALRQQAARQAVQLRPQVPRQRSTGLVQMEVNGAACALPPMPPSMSQVSSLEGLAGLNPAIAQAILSGQMNIDDVLSNPSLLAQAAAPLTTSDPMDFLAPSYDNASSSAEVENPNFMPKVELQEEPDATRIRTA